MNWNGIISLFIACIELLLLINLITFAEKSRFNITAMVIVTLLFLYQSAEAFICTFGFEDPAFVYIAFVIISYLPPLGVLLAASLNNVKNKFLYLLFLPPLFFTFYYKIIIDEFAVTSCAVLYASYHYPLGDLYGAFYYLPIIATIIWLARTLKKVPDKKVKTISSVLLFGYIFTCIPNIIAFVLMAYENYSLISKIESIMCKFAFILALCLSFAAIYNSTKKNE
ncbi:MAG: hypothetical protein R6W68_12265 [Ignavibacteriaceae bacterium]